MNSKLRTDASTKNFCHTDFWGEGVSESFEKEKFVTKNFVSSNIELGKF